MNWDQVQGKWTQLTGSVKEKWGKLTDDDLKVIDGKRDRLVGKIQERYGVTKENAEDQVATWTIPNASFEEMPRRKAS
ncbi:MAG TPA: CsbD family protein [Terriglobales bacterium]|nr:CsbD family protein [Terriglobales bacterium]